MNLIKQGNNKLGKNILTWSIPAIKTCPGSTPACRELCYADEGWYRSGGVKKSLTSNLKSTKSTNYVANVIAELKRSKLSIVRIHVAGDFYSPEYAMSWYEIIKQCPEKTFFVYTRSWRIPSIMNVISGLAKLPNLKLWFSVDKDTDKPIHIPKGVRLAYMMTNETDIPKYKVDLFFRDVRKGVVKKINNTLVCPKENGITNTTCEKCGFCWRK